MDCILLSFPVTPMVILRSGEVSREVAGKITLVLHGKIDDLMPGKKQLIMLLIHQNFGAPFRKKIIRLKYFHLQIVFIYRKRHWKNIIRALAHLTKYLIYWSLLYIRTEFISVLI